MKINAVESFENLTLKEIAQWVKSKERQYSFIKDSIDYKAENPITNKEFKKLMQLLTVYSKSDYKRIKIAINNEKSILKKEDFIDKLKEHKMLTRYLKSIDSDQLNNLNFNCNFNCNFNLKSIKYSLLSMKSELIRFEKEGFEKIVQTYEKDINLKLKVNEFYDTVNNLLCKLVFFNKKLYYKRIYIPNKFNIEDFKLNLKEICKDIEANGKLTLKCKLKNIKAINTLKKSKINKENIRKLDDFIDIYNYIKMKSIEKRLILYWNKNCKYLSLDRLEKINTDKLLFIENKLENIKNIIKFHEEYSVKVVKEVMNNDGNSASIYNLKDIENLYNKALIKSRILECERLEKQIKKIKILFLDLNINNISKYIKEYNYKGIEECYLIMKEILEKRNDINTLENTLDKINKVMPEFTTEVFLNSSKYLEIDFVEFFKYAKYKSLLSGNLKKKYKKCS